MKSLKKVVGITGVTAATLFREIQGSRYVKQTT